MINKGYEILNSLDPEIDTWLTSNILFLCDTNVMCPCVPPDNDCSCTHPNELDCSYRMGNR